MDITQLPGVKEYLAGTIDYQDIPQSTQEKLYEYFQPDMPYGTQKGRDGDPDQWIQNQLDQGRF